MCVPEAIQRTYLFAKTSKRMSNQAVPKLELAGVKSSGLAPKLVARAQSPTTGSANFWQALAKEGVEQNVWKTVGNVEKKSENRVWQALKMLC